MGLQVLPILGEATGGFLGLSVGAQGPLMLLSLRACVCVCVWKCKAFWT